MAELNPKVEALCHALGESFSMNSPEEKVIFRQILVSELTKAGFLDAKGNVVVIKTPAVAPVAVGVTGAPATGVTESYQQFMSRRNTELKPTVAEWPQRKTMIKEEWDATHKGGAKMSDFELYMKKQLDSYVKEENRLKTIHSIWNGLSEEEKAQWVTKSQVVPQAEPAK
jgi:hypothetical protein